MDAVQGLSGEPLTPEKKAEVLAQVQNALQLENMKQMVEVNSRYCENRDKVIAVP
jgi:hypothetical protein